MTPSYQELWVFDLWVKAELRYYLQIKIINYWNMIRGSKSMLSNSICTALQLLESVFAQRRIYDTGRFSYLSNRYASLVSGIGQELTSKQRNGVSTTTFLLDFRPLCMAARLPNTGCRRSQNLRSIVLFSKRQTLSSPASKGHYAIMNKWPTKETKWRTLSPIDTTIWYPCSSSSIRNNWYLYSR